MNRNMMWALVLASGLATAADQVDQAGRVPPELRSCVGIARNTERLACFDRGVAALMGAQGASAPSPESSFGLVATTPRAIESNDDSGSVQKVSGKVSALSVSNDGSAVITLDNGQVWRQLSGGQLLLKPGDDVEINRAALGSFQMKVPTGRSAKVKRVR